MQERSDAELVASHLAGEEGAFNELYRRYYKKVVNRAYRLTWDIELARDIAQEVFLRVAKYLHTWEESTKFDAWVFSITHNRTSTERARPWVKYDHASEVTPDGEVLDKGRIWGWYLPDQTDLFAEVERQELKEIVREVVSQLPSVDQEIITLHYFEELELPQIGLRLGIPAPTAGGRLQRARARMRKLIGNRLAA